MPAIAEPMNIKMGPLNFLGRDQTHLFFSADRPVTDDLVIKINNEYYPFGNGIYPATDWKPGEIVEIAPPVAGDKITMQLYSIKGGLNVASDGGLIFSYDAETPTSGAVSLP